MDYKLKLKAPIMPNFINVEGTASLGSPQIAVSDLDKKQAEEFGELMKQEFIKHWEKKTKG